MLGRSTRLVLLPSSLRGALCGVKQSLMQHVPASTQNQRPLCASMATVTRTGRFVQTRTTGQGVNKHRSNRAKKGLFHGKDIQFGNSVSHSMAHTRRRWYPNVKNKSTI